MMKKPYLAYRKKRGGKANETFVVRGRPITYHAPYQQVATVSQNQQPFTIPTNPMPKCE